MIQTKSVNNRDDWYQGLASVNGKSYVSWEMTRQAAFMAILRQLANAHIIKW